jgi:hypothetical protein
MVVVGAGAGIYMEEVPVISQQLLRPKVTTGLMGIARHITAAAVAVGQGVLARTVLVGLVVQVVLAVLVLTVQLRVLLLGMPEVVTVALGQI